MDKLKVILIPGNGGGDVNDPLGWFPYVKSELEKLEAAIPDWKHEIQVLSKNFPDPILAREEYWIPYIKGLGADENTILVGYSSGAIAAMRFAENNKILGTVLVGGYYTDLGMESEKVSGYFNRPWQWEKIRKNQKWIIQFHSTDDPFIPTEEAHFVRDKLNTQYFEFADKEHFGYPTEMAEFPELVEEIKKKLS